MDWSRVFFVQFAVLLGFVWIVSRLSQLSVRQILKATVCAFLPVRPEGQTDRLLLLLRRPAMRVAIASSRSPSSAHPCANPVNAPRAEMAAAPWPRADAMTVPAIAWEVEDVLVWLPPDRGAALYEAGYGWATQKPLRPLKAEPVPVYGPDHSFNQEGVA